MVSHVFKPNGANFPTANFPQLSINSAAGYSHPTLDFDSSTDEIAFFGFLPVEYGGGTITVDVYWTSKSATTGTVMWGAQIMAVTPSTEDIFTDGYGTAETSTADTVPGTNGYVLKSTITMDTAGELDSLAAGDDANLKLYRDVSGDTMASDACLLKVELSYDAA